MCGVFSPIWRGVRPTTLRMAVRCTMTFERGREWREGEAKVACEEAAGNLQDSRHSREMSQAETYHILFVCMGNICRSPAGENVLRAAVEAAGIGDRFRIDSAGTISLHTGDPPDARMSRASAARGLPAEGRARQVKAADFDRFDLILAMDDDNLADLEAIASGGQGQRAHLQLFCDFCTRHDDHEVPDPYYGGADGFEKVLDLLDDGCAEIIAAWRRGELPGQRGMKYEG